MFKKFQPTWYGAFLLMLWLLCATVLGLIIAISVSKKFTHQYSLGTKGGSLSITKEIDWCPDDEIQLDRQTTCSEAVRLVDSLNKTLKH